MIANIVKLCTDGADKVNKALDTDELSKAYREAREYITNRCQAIANKFADSKEFNKNVDKSIKALGKYADKVIDEYIGMGEQYLVNEAAESAERGRELKYNYAVGAY